MHKIRRFIAALAVATLVSSAAVATARRTSLEEADRLFAAGEFGRAAEAYRNLARAADAPELRLRLAAALLKRERPAEALAAAETAVAAAATSQSLAVRSLAFFRAGRFAGAERDRDLALADKSPSPLAHLADAKLLSSEGRFAEAIAAADRALEGESLLDRVFRFDALTIRADALEETSGADAAFSAFEAATAAAPPTNEILTTNLAAQLAFRRATLGRPYYRIASAPDAVALPMTIRHGIPIVYVSLNGADPEPFILDTGAGISVLFPRYAKKAGFKARDERAWAGAVGGDGRVPIRFGLADSIGLGAIKVENVPFAVIDWELPNLAGIVGLPLLRSFVATVDYKKSELRLAKPGKIAMEGEGTPFRLVGNAMFVDASVNGKGPFNFELDTGASTEGVPLDKTVADAIGLSDSAPNTRRTKGSGAAGDQEAVVHPNARIAWAGLEPMSVSLMSQRITPARPERRDGESGLTAETELEGLIGYAVLKRYAVTIDFQRFRLVVR